MPFIEKDSVYTIFGYGSIVACPNEANNMYKVKLLSGAIAYINVL